MSAVRYLSAALFLMIAASGQAHEYKIDSMRIAHPFAVETPPGAQTGAAYIDITNQSNAPLLLKSVRTHMADTVEIHTMSMADGIMKMRALEQLTIAAGETLKMRPGMGIHLMLIGLEQQLQDGNRFELWLNFEGQNEFPVEVRIQTREAGITAADAHHQH